MQKSLQEVGQETLKIGSRKNNCQYIFCHIQSADNSYNSYCLTGLSAADVFPESENWYLKMVYKIRKLDLHLPVMSWQQFSIIYWSWLILNVIGDQDLWNSSSTFKQRQLFFLSLLFPTTLVYYFQLYMQVYCPSFYSSESLI